MKRLTLTRPDDWHVHLRDGAMLDYLVPDTAARFERAIVMPNLVPPVTTVSQALAYRERILAVLGEEAHFEPLMTLYLTDNMSPDEIERVAQCPQVLALKLYPAGATTNSDAGVTDLALVEPALQAMQDQDVPLLIHGEVVGAEVDVFDREAVFIDRHLRPLVERFPELRVVLEHVTTKEGIDFVSSASAKVGATITPHHLLINRNAIFSGGIRPHHYCLPVAKRERHRQALLDAAVSGSSKFFLGTDSAPHPRQAKEASCGCAGIYVAHAAIELYAQAFEAAGALEKLEAFASFNGADFYRLPRNTGTITLERRAWRVPETFPFDEGRLVPFGAGDTIDWQVAEV